MAAKFNIAEIIISKQRHGPIGKVEVGFDPARVKFLGPRTQPWRRPPDGPEPIGGGFGGGGFGGGGFGGGEGWRPPARASCPMARTERSHLRVNRT